MAGTPRIQFKQITKRYPGVLALDDVSFDVMPASVHAVVGENGAGKSTLMKVLSGGTQAQQGTIRLDGEAAVIRNAREAQAHGVSIVHQEFNLAPDLSVSENVFLGRWPRGPLGTVHFRELHRRTETLFSSLGVNLPPHRKVGGLTVGAQQMVEIAKALSLDARVLVLDEPSAVLTPHELETLFAIVRRLTADGVSVLYISHRLEEIFELAHYVTVLRDGRHISTRPIDDVNRERLIHEMVGRSIEEEYPARAATIGEVVLQVRGLSAGRRFQGVDFDLRAGEVLGLTGLVGSGRSSVGKAIFGAIPTAGGEVRLRDRRGPFRSPRQGQRAGVAFLPEDRKSEGLLLWRSLQENTTLAHLPAVSRGGVLRSEREKQITERQMASFGIKAPSGAVAARTLSGGNQQKVMLARWLQQPYPVIILDEPTRGVDVGAKVEIYNLINGMAQDGAAVLMISSELPEVIGIADRIGVMCEGRLAGILDNGQRDVSQEQIMRLAVRTSAA